MAVGYDLKHTPPGILAAFVSKLHKYKSCPTNLQYSLALYEEGIITAAFAFNVPIAGCAKSVMSDNPNAVLCLTRMVKHETSRVRHVSKVLRHIMENVIDRDRWKAVVSYSDSSLGHNGYVYQCAGFARDGDRPSRVFVNSRGERCSPFSNGSKARGAIYVCDNVLTRWVKQWP